METNLHLPCLYNLAPAPFCIPSCQKGIILWFRECYIRNVLRYYTYKRGVKVINSLLPSAFPLNSISVEKSGSGVACAGPAEVSLRELFFLKKLLLEQDHQRHSYRDGRIGNIEDGVEEQEVFVTPNGDPRRESSLKKREIKHVNHSSVKQTRVAAFLRKKCCHMAVAIVENDTVERTVNDVSERSGKNQGDGHNHNGVRAFLGNTEKVPTNGNNGNDTEEAQCQFAHFATEFHPEGHPHILGEVDDEPIGDVEFLTEGHVGLDPDLRNLIENEYRKDDGECFLQLNGK